MVLEYPQIQDAVDALRLTHHQEAYKDLLLKVFYAGMYMRRWRGPGHPYPHMVEETKGSFDPNPNVTLALNAVHEAAATLPKYYRLPVIDYYDYRLYVYEWLGVLLDEIRAGDKCIRMASTLLIYTAAYYLEQAFGVKIPDFDIHRLERIS